MHAIVDIGLPVLIIVAMTIVGLELTIADLLRVLEYPLHVAIVLLAQMVLLPLIATALILFLHPAPAVAGGLILTATAPQALSSNYFCLLARVDVALSVTLTAASSALAMITTPLAASLAFDLLIDPGARFALPFAKAMQQITSGLLLPIVVGMLVRHYAPEFVKRHRARFQSLSLVMLSVMIVILLAHEAGNIQRNLGTIVFAALLFTIAAAVLGWALAYSFSWSREETITMIAAFPSRSLSIATLLAVSVLGRVEFLSFALVFFLAQTLLLAPSMILLRAARVPG